MELTWGIAAVWLGLALLASLLSIRFKLSVALVEILVGTAAGNLALLLDHYHVFGRHWEIGPNEWIAFLAGFGSILLTFMAGAEIDSRDRGDRQRDRADHDRAEMVPARYRAGGGGDRPAGRGWKRHEGR